MKVQAFVRVGLVVAMASVTVSCDEVEDNGRDVEALPRITEVTVGPNGERVISFRGEVENGVELNGALLNGWRLNGWRLNGWRLNGSMLNNLAINLNGNLSGDDESESHVEPDDNAVLTADSDNDVTMEEYEIEESEFEVVAELPFTFRRIRYRVKPSGDWDDACYDTYGNPTKGVVLQGTSDDASGARLETPTDGTTYACRGTALGKCVEWGYHPQGTYSSTDLGDHHQACTRMVRADYCGDGEHHTENGTVIDVEDDLSINVHESETNENIEAAWGPDGALCLNNPRKTWWTRTDALTNCSSVPSCDHNNNGNLKDDEAYWYGQGALFITRNTPTALNVEPPAPPEG